MSETTLQSAVQNEKLSSKQGLLQKLFAVWFDAFVYNQIWEDPRVDIEALKLDGESRILTISSGGCNAMNYRMVLFHTNVNGAPVYHTNVLMAIGEKTAVVCFDAITNEKENALVEATLSRHHEIIQIDVEQMKAFAANMLLVQTKDDTNRWVMSLTSFKSLSAAQRDALRRDGELLPLDIYTIETFGGGSARCMLAETAW